MKKISFALTVLLALAGTGCANRQYSSVVDPRAGYNPANGSYPAGRQNYGYSGYDGYRNQSGYQSGYQVEQDKRECDGYAREASGGMAGETMKGAAIGGLGGAALGAAVGAIAGDPGMGAALGAAVGGIGGGGYGAYNSNDSYESAFNRCMRGRGHNPLN